MSTVDAYDAVRSFLSVQWNACPLVWPNEEYAPPSGETWIMAEMSSVSFEAMTIGSGDPHADRWDEDGWLILHIMVPIGNGDRDARVKASALADLFRGLRLFGDRLEFGRMTIGADGGRTEDNTWFRFTVEIEWRLIGV